MRPGEFFLRSKLPPRYVDAIHKELLLVCLMLAYGARR
jgi:hypothetical protein